MRRAYQRCSTALARAGAPPTTSFSSNVCLRCNILRSVEPLQRPTYRALHQTSLRRAAAAQAVRSEEHADNGESGGRITKFADLETRKIIHPNVVRTLTRDMGLETMTEVQTATINEALKGTDIIAQARTGTGKTLAFLLPLLQNILTVDPQLAQPSNSRRGPRTTADDIRAIIISPTRELAEQIAVEARRLVANTSVLVQTAVGGTQKSHGLRLIQREGCHLLVGTPGRLKDILTDPYSKVEAPDLSALVFDEADRLMDQGFWPEIQEIMRLLPTPAERNRQTLMFSATVPQEVVNLVRSTLKPGFQFVKTVSDDEEPTHTRVPQRLATVKGFENKLPALIELCTRGIEASKQPGGKPFKAIVYYNSTAEVSFAKSAFRGLKSANSQSSSSAFGMGAQHPLSPARIYDIHARLTQGQRTAAAEMFRTCDSGILLSSDVTARGMDFPNVTHVIQMSCPPNREQYIHRIGRTARAGKEGEGWLIVNEDEADEIRHMLRKLPIKSDRSLATASIDLTQESQVPAQAGALLAMVQQSIQNIPLSEKYNVYKALLGVYGWLGNKRTLVNSMNNLAKYGWGMSEPPTVAPLLAQRLGLSRVPGLNIGHPPPEVEDAMAMRRGPGGRGGDFGRSSDGRGSGFSADRGFGGRDGGRGGGFGGSRDGGRGGGFGGRDGGSRGGSFGDRGAGRSGGFGSRDGAGRSSGFGSRDGGRSEGGRGGFSGGGSRGGFGERSLGERRPRTFDAER